MQRRASIAVLGCLILALIVIGCGGGGGQAGTGTTTSATGGTTGLTLMPSAQRATIIAAAQTALNSVPMTGGIRNAQSLLSAEKAVHGLQLLQTTPDGGVAGEFSDGVPISFINDFPQNPNAPTPAMAPPLVKTRNQPASATAKILDSEDPYLFQNHSNDDAAMFNSNGYPGTTLTKSTIEAFRALGGSPMGCLYVAGHGGTSFNPATKQLTGFGLWTATPAVFAAGPGFNGTTYSSDLADGSLAVAFAASAINPQNPGSPIFACHYMILTPFISKYHWSFAANSFVTLGVCEGGSTESAVMRTALFNAGASVIAAWNGEAYSSASYYNNSYLFDRMLGANVIQAADPPRRPFTWAQILTVLKKGTTVSYTAEGKPTTWTFFSNPNTPSGGGFTSLRPTLQSMLLDESTGTLTLIGDFGSEMGKIFAGGTQLQVTSWTDSVISCSIPSSGPGSTGEVYAQSPPVGSFSPLTSNRRFLSSWTGTVTDTQTQEGVQIGHATMKLLFRGDVGTVYLAPDGTLQPSQGAAAWKTPIDLTVLNALTETSASTCAVTAGGTFSDSSGDKYIYSYTGPATLPPVVNGNSGNYFVCVLGVPSSPGQQGRLRMQAIASNALNVTIDYPDGSPYNTVTNQIFQTEREAGNVNHGDALTEFDTQYNMSTGTLGNTDGEVVDWGAFPCTSPPDQTSAR